VKLWDCFPFNAELDLLELRLHELDSVVDRFVLVEADRTFTGVAKPLHFAANAGRFAAFRDRIVHIVVTDMPCGPDPWVRESFQRNAIVRGLDGLGDGDIVLISDVDEIPRRDAVAEVRRGRHAVTGLRMPLFYFRFNFLNVARAVHTARLIAIRGRGFRSAQEARELRAGFENLYRRCCKLLTAPPAIPHAGWHFSYLGDESFVANKLRAYAHAADPDHAGVLDRLDIEGMIDDRRDLFGHAGFRWEVVRVDDYFPPYVLANRQRFAHLIAPEGIARMDDFGKLMKREASEIFHTWEGLARRWPLLR